MNAQEGGDKTAFEQQLSWLQADLRRVFGPNASCDVQPVALSGTGLGLGTLVMIDTDMVGPLAGRISFATECEDRTKVTRAVLEASMSLLPVTQDFDWPQLYFNFGQLVAKAFTRQGWRLRP